MLNSTSSLKTVDSLSCTGANESQTGSTQLCCGHPYYSSRELSHEHAVSSSVSVTAQSSQAQKESVLKPILVLSMTPSSISLLIRANCLQHCFTREMARIQYTVLHMKCPPGTRPWGSIHVQSLRQSFCIRSLFHRRTSFRCVDLFRKRLIISQTTPLPTPTPFRRTFAYFDAIADSTQLRGSTDSNSCMESTRHCRHSGRSKEKGMVILSWVDIDKR